MDDTDIVAWLRQEADDWEPDDETYEEGYRSPAGCAAWRSKASSLSASEAGIAEIAWCWAGPAGHIRTANAVTSSMLTKPANDTAIRRQNGGAT